MFGIGGGGGGGGELFQGRIIYPGINLAQEDKQTIRGDEMI